MRYSYQVIKGKKYSVKSQQFQSILGEGSNEEKAFDNFVTKVFGVIRYCLDNDIQVPEEFKGRPGSSKTFGLPLNMVLKIKLHNTRILKGVSHTELARLLAFTYRDVPEGNWMLDALRSLTPEALPKYKKVQRLFDIDHESKVREIEQAYRVLGFNVNVEPYERTYSD